MKEGVNLRGSMVEINPYKDDLFRKIIEQRKLHKSDAALYYWLKILANSIYGFFVELNPESQSKNVLVNVFSGEKKFSCPSDVLEKEGKWFSPPFASLITAGGRLLLAMAEARVGRKTWYVPFLRYRFSCHCQFQKRWAAEYSRKQPNEILSWDGSAGNCGQIRFLESFITGKL